MSALAIDLPEDVSAARDGILKFAEQEIFLPPCGISVFLKTREQCMAKMASFQRLYRA